MSSPVTASSDALAALRAAADALRAVGIEEPRLDAEVLLAEATGLDRAALAAGAAVEPAAARRFGELVRRRLRREPVAYILGRKGFRRLELAVDRRVLVPRPETELLVELALELRPRRVLDVGTGSGAIALAVADELPAAEVVATDTSPGALAVARANAARLGLADRVRFLVGTLPGPEAGAGIAGGARAEAGPAGGVGAAPEAGAAGGRGAAAEAGPPPEAGAEAGGGSAPWAGAAGGPGAAAEAGAPPEAEPLDLILANLPYVAEREWPSLQPEVTRWEPREALLAGPDGLDAYRSLIPACGRLLSSPAHRGRPLSAIGGQRTTTDPDRGQRTTTLAVEVGEGQAAAVAELVRGAGWGVVETRRDLAGIERVVVGRGGGR